MSFFAMLKRALEDLTDPSLLLLTFLVLYVTNNVLSIPLLDAFGSALQAYINTGSVLMFVRTFCQSLNIISFISLLVTLFLYVYLTGFAVARIWQRRSGEKINPFRVSLENWFSTFVSIIFVGFFPTLFLFLYALYQPYPIASVLNALLLLSLLVWVPFSLPVITASVVEKVRGRDRVYEGLLAGKVYWWKVLLGMVLGYLIYYALWQILSQFYAGPYYLILTLIPNTVHTVWIYSLSAESYYGFKIGE